MARTKKNQEQTEVVKEVKNEVIETVKERNMEEVKMETKTTNRLSGRLRSNSDTINTDNLDKKRRVPVLSVFSGTVGYQCKLSPNFLTWEQYGDEQEMSIGELLIMYSQEKMFFTDCVILVDDEEFAETLKLTDKYQSIFETEDLSVFYKNSNPTILKNKILDLPEAIRKQTLVRTVNAINSGELSNLNVIKMLKKEFDLDVEIF